MSTREHVAPGPPRVSHGPRGHGATPECLQHVIHAVAVLNGRWAPAVLATLYFAVSPCRFSELHRRIDGISQKELARHLAHLVEQGVIRREAAQRSVRYALTTDGLQLLARMKSLGEWSQGRRHRLGLGDGRTRTWLDPILR